MMVYLPSFVKFILQIVLDLDCRSVSQNSFPALEEVRRQLALKFNSFGNITRVSWPIFL